MPQALLIADLHLSSERPETTERFLRFLRGQAAGVEALYILGDLFDSWVGDDDPAGDAISEALRALTDGGTRLWLQHGNRDFLIGADFLRRAGATLLAEEAPAELPSGIALLMHGDTLCTDDLPYQQARKQLRNPGFIADFLSKPLEERKILAREYRRRSGEATSLQAADLMDVNTGAVADALRRHGVTTLIHGHTHRPGHHPFLLDGRPANRWVLPEWHADQGGCLRADDNGLRFETVP